MMTSHTKDMCPHCNGEGIITFEVARPQGFGRDIGVIDVMTEPCSRCGGDGEVEIDEVDF